MYNIGKQLDSFFEAYSGNVPGAAIGFNNNDEILMKNYGMRDVEKSIPVTSDTTFRLASLTKAFMATSILLLVEDNRLRLNNCVNDVIPEFPDYGKKISIKNLLNHTSGLASYSDTEVIHQLLDDDVLIQLKSHNSTVFPPGSKYEYSNAGYVLLGIIVREISGMSLPEFMHKNIFNPLKMENTVLFLKGFNEVRNRAYGYTKTANGFFLNDQSKTSALLGDGGVYSSVIDMMKWDESVTSEKLLSHVTLVEASTPSKLNNGEKINYGYGWHLAEFHDLKCVYHSGSTAGFRNLIVRIPEKKTSFIILTNREIVDVNTEDKDSLLGAREDFFRIFSI
ncbi:beta-lactamase family protein [Candidatus Bathyarchaeota archaeon]|nr:beta-lactamase family protein [Candidatus Bathyarchaeota archaeon]